MNLFILDEDPYVAATMMVDKHVVKQILETAQMLSTAHRIIDGDENGELDDDRANVYRITHKNHPCSLWIRSSVSNYQWAADHLHGLLGEYTHRYGKDHATGRLYYVLQSPPGGLKDWERTPFVLAMPDEYKIEGSAVESYRNYYRLGKAHLHSWKNRGMPRWLRLTNT